MGKTYSVEGLLKIKLISVVRLFLQRYKNVAEVPSGPKSRMAASGSTVASFCSKVFDNFSR